jgi:hypothetical protein
MTRKNHQVPADAFFERLLDWSDPHAEARDDHLCQARLLCGRWLALRRLRLGIPLEILAERAGWPQQTLLFVELGLAEQAHALPADECLVCQLAGPFGDHAWIAMVLAIALGRVCQPSDRIMRRIAADLDAVCEPQQGRDTSF